MTILAASLDPHTARRVRRLRRRAARSRDRLSASRHRSVEWSLVLDPATIRSGDAVLPKVV